MLQINLKDRATVRSKRCASARSQEQITHASSELIAITFFFAFTLRGFNADLFVILLQRCKIFSSLREFTFLHTFSNIPMYESTLGVHQVELVIDAREHLGDCGGVADHTARTHDLSQVTTRDNRWWLIIDSALEASGAPIDEL